MTLTLPQYTTFPDFHKELITLTLPQYSTFPHPPQGVAVSYLAPILHIFRPHTRSLLLLPYHNITHFQIPNKELMTLTLPQYSTFPHPPQGVDDSYLATIFNISTSPTRSCCVLPYHNIPNFQTSTRS